MDQVPGNPDTSAAAGGMRTCYRHPDRATGVSCTRCERPICPECMISASGHAPHVSRPRTVAGGTVTSDPRLVTKILLGINLAVWLAVLAVDLPLLRELDMVGDGQPGTSHPVGVAQGEWYRLLTAMFLHQQPMHIAFNMLSLWWLGPPLEAALGRLRYVALYLLSGLGGSALTYLLAPQDQPSLGASGAIFGLLGATAVLVRRMNYSMRPVMIVLALNLVITFTWPNIAWQAHVGGLVTGAVVAYAMVHAPRERRDLVQAATCAVVLVAIVAAVWARTLALTG
jgi:membrane associated rhomboid family serine protease